MRPFFISLGLILGTCLPGGVNANPQNANIVHGDVTIENYGNTLQILQGSDKAIIEWGDFSIGLEEATQFLQPGSSSSVLNRVMGGNASAIDGILEANGRVLLINPNGILFGPNATVDTGGFLASTLDLSDENFLGGGDLFFSGASPAAIVNLGAISASDGDVILIANQVSNQGSINAPNGMVGLGAGTEVLLAESGNERMFVRGGIGGSVGVDNAGSIEAQVSELKAGGSIYATAIRNSGRVRATSVHREGGRIMLKANGGNIVNLGGVTASNGDNQSGVEIDAGIGGNVVFEANGEAVADSVSIATEGGRIAVNEGASVKATSVDFRAPSGSIDVSGEIVGHDSALAQSQILLDSSPGGSIDIGPTGFVQASGVAMTADLGQVVVQSGGRVQGETVNLQAEGGRITHLGIIKSEDAAGNGGQVSMSAGAGGIVEVGGVVDTKGRIGNGGSITVSGEEVAIRAGALLEADGETGGGQILVGGGYQGSDPAIFNSQRTVVEPGAVLSANAVSSGNGGTIVVWSDDETVFRGSISATAVGDGKGGLAEVSGKQTLTFDGLVNLSAEKVGNSGILLLDPTNFTIDSSGDANTASAASIESVLGSGTSVTILTDSAGSEDGDVWVNEAIDVQTSSGIFTILAHDDIFVEKSIQIGGTTGAVNLVAGWDGSTGFQTVPSSGVANNSVADIAEIADSQSGYGNGDSGDRGNIFIGDTSAAWVGSQSGPTAIFGYNVNVGTESGIGYTGANGTDISGQISVAAKNDISVTNSGPGSSGIGHRSSASTAAIDGEIDLRAETGDITVMADSGYEVRIGHEGMDSVSGGILLEARQGAIVLDSGDGKVVVGSLGNSTVGEIVLDAKSITLDATGGGTAKVGGEESGGGGGSGSIAIRGFEGIALLDSEGEESSGGWEIGHGGSGAGMSDLIFLGKDLTIDSELSNRLIGANLGGGDVTIGGYGDVSIATDVNVNADYDLHFLAAGDLSLSADITNSSVSGGDVFFIAGWDGVTGVEKVGPPSFDPTDLSADLTSFGNNEATVTTDGLVSLGTGTLEIFAQSVSVESTLADAAMSTKIQLSDHMRSGDPNGLKGGMLELQAGIGTAQVKGGSLSDLIQGPDLDVFWSINQDNGGSVSFSDSSFGVIGFESIENLSGGTANDSFTFTDQASLAGRVDGGGGSGIDALKIDDSNLVAEGSVTYNITNGLVSRNPQYTFRSVDSVEIEGGDNDSTFNTQFFDFTQQITGGVGTNTLNVTLAAGVAQPTDPASPLTQSGSGQIAFSNMNSVNFANRSATGDSGAPAGGGNQNGGGGVLPNANNPNPVGGNGSPDPNGENQEGVVGRGVEELDGQIGTQLDNTTENSNPNGNPEGEQTMQQDGDEEDAQNPDPAQNQTPAGNTGGTTPPGEEKPVTNESGVQETTGEGTSTVAPPDNVGGELDNQLGPQGQTDFQSTGLNVN